MIRFEDTPQSVVELANKIQGQYFPELTKVKTKYLFDDKKRTSGGKIVLGRCQKTDDLVKYFTIDEANDEEGYQYIISLDKIAYDNIEEIDRIRLFRHELRHILFFETEEKTVYKINPHNIEDFVEEIELNTDDPRWAMRITSLIETIYEQIEDDEKDTREAITAEEIK